MNERGVQLLEEVRYEELDSNTRKLHDGQLLVVGAMYQQMKAFERRMSAVEKALRNNLGGEDTAGQVVAG